MVGFITDIEDRNMSFWGKLFNKSSDKWVYILRNDYITDYYDSKSVYIIKEISHIHVWCKRIYTTKGNNLLISQWETQNIRNDKPTDFNFSMNQYIFNYDKMTIQNCRIMYFKNGQSLDNIVYPPIYEEWEDIKPGTINDIILTKLLKDYNIQINWDCDDWMEVTINEYFTLYRMFHF